MSKSRSQLVAVAVLASSFGLLYWPVIRKLVHDWATDDNYSHGFIIVPVAVYFVYERWARLVTLDVRPSWMGLLIIAGSIGVLLVGQLGAELFLTRISMIGTVIGAVVFALGWGHLAALAFPIAFLLLMVPLPAIVFNQVAFPLQLLASRVGEAALTTCQIPVLREGNVIVLANTTLEVAEACSGIRSLVSLLTLAIVYGYFADRRRSVRVLLAALTIPLAIFTNGLRVAGTGIAAHFYGAGVAQGFLHTSSGFLVFLAAFGLLCVAGYAIQRIMPVPDQAIAPVSAT